jgi:hypothetical protein
MMTDGTGNADNNENVNIDVETLAETERYTIWRAREPDGEIQYHIDMENVTVHFFQEEWDELLAIMRDFLDGDAPARKPNKGGKR